MLLNKLKNLSRFQKQLIIFSVDFFLLPSILFLSFAIRYGYWYFPHTDFIFWLTFSSSIIGSSIFAFFGLYKSVTRYVGFNALWLIVKAVSIYALVWGVIFLAGFGVPRSVVFINWILSILIIVGIRVVAKWVLTSAARKQNAVQSGHNPKRVLIYGAGHAGVHLAGALTYSSEYVALGFIDDSKELQGNSILGLKVFSIDQISKVINEHKIDEVLLAVPSASRRKRFNIISLLEPFSVKVRMLPAVEDLVGGRVSVDDLHEVKIEDLLGRDSVPANQELLGKNITGKIVLVTGAGGSIGAEICRQVLSLKPKTLILFEISELALYKIEKKLSTNNLNQVDIYPILGSTLNKTRLNSVFSYFKVETVYHAAAYKHVPMVEFNNTEGVDNNIFGTLNCSQAAIDNGVDTFVLISTDKAVRPANTMGATKRIAELILQALSSTQKNTKFTMVRFGNVLDSSGSVIPLFKEQIKDGGPVTVTDKNIFRYFMTISEAVELVIQAGAMGAGGEVFVLDMGEPVSIVSLAKKMIRLSGLVLKDEINPDGDIEIEYTGLRPGEKLYEELLIGDNTFSTDNALIMRAREDMVSWEKLKPVLDDLNKVVESCDQEKIRMLLLKLVPDFKPQCEIKDILYKKI